MAVEVVHTRASRRELLAMLRALPAAVSGNGPDIGNVGHGFRMRLAVGFFGTIKQAFVTKARGGTDEAGDSWPPLSQRYLAYRRPVTGRKPPRAGKLAPGGKDGFMNQKDLARWRKDFRQALAWLAVKEPLEVAKGKAAAIAWSRAKKAGVKTKLDVFGKRTNVEILRDRGLLLNSLSPGQMSGESYSAQPGQVVREEPGALIVGSNLVVADYHHGPRRKSKGRGVGPQRRLWPEPSRFPSLWWQDWLEVGRTGLQQAVALLAKGMS